MTTEEYKQIFKSFPERAWLSSTLQKLVKGGEYDEIIDLLNGTKDIDDVKEIENLYEIRTTFFKLKANCSMIQENIEKLDLFFIGDFSDKKMELEEIGIKPDDVFVCKKDFKHWDMVKINVGSEIKIIDFSYAGKRSQLECRFINHITDEVTRKHFSDSDEIKLLFSFQELSDYFDRK
ncbi:MAG: hypothetical protein AB7S69_05165 [Salinivirgaceae bacterium]